MTETALIIDGTSRDISAGFNYSALAKDDAAHALAATRSVVKQEGL